MDFDAAVMLVRQGGVRASNEEKLMLYGLYKVATVGQPPPASPGADPVSTAKWNAWKQFADMSEQKARSSYASLCHVLSRRS